jgi:SAM-dependent methyltransferase
VTNLGGALLLSVYMKSERSIIEVPLASYEEIASEYYDPARHPTCANFREGSARILREWLKRYSVAVDGIFEVGAGNSLLAELLVEMGKELNDVVISDPSPSMLEFSTRWADRGARVSLNRAETLPVESENLGLLVSSLGDPYNETTFWDEAYRVLRPGGKVFFTTPAYEWARAFRLQRGQAEIMLAEFELRGGHKVLVPSWIYPVEQQVQLMKSSGFEIEEIVQVRRSALEPEHLSPKLLVDHCDDINVVTGYLCMKPLR